MKNSTLNRLLSVVLAAVLTLCAMPIYRQAASASGEAVQQMANIIVFVKFADDETDVFNAPAEGFVKSAWERTNAYYNDTSAMYQGIDCSFKNYISSISNGKLNVTNYFPQESSGVIDTLVLKNGMTYYESSDELLLDEVTDFLTACTSFPATGAKVDNICSGVIDNLTVLIQGDESDDTNSLLWPHKSVSGSPDKVKGLYYIRNYNIINSSSFFSLKQGVISHEFLHSVGFADLYHYNSVGTPVGQWDIMGGTSPYLQYPLAYTRSLMGWTQLSEATQSGTYTLNVSSAASGTTSIKVATPMSATEFFVFEYRVREQSSYAGLGFNTKLPSSGLTVYRVNNALEHYTNSGATSYAEDYIYVFRPYDETGTVMFDNINDAAINPDDGETSYGSADFTAASTADTIHYSSGKNSGLTVSNVTYSQDKSQITFTLSFPDYSSLDLWDTLGSVITSGSGGDNDMIFAPDGTPYAAVTKYSENMDSSIEVYSYTNSAWSRLSTLSNIYSPRLAFRDGVLYMAYLKSANGSPAVSKLVNGSWSVCAADTSVSYPDSLDLITDGTELYLVYCSNDYMQSNTAVIKQLSGNSLSVYDNSFVSGNALANAKFAFFDGKLYMLFSYFGWNLSETRSLVYSLDPIFGWQQCTVFGPSNPNMHDLKVDSGKLYAVSGVANSAATLTCFDGTSWSTQEVSVGSVSGSGLSLAAENGTVFLTYKQNGKVHCSAYSGEAWEELGSGVTENCSTYMISLRDGTVYVLCADDTTGNLTLYYRELSQSGQQVPVAMLTEGSHAIINNEKNLITVPGSGISDLSFYVYATQGGSLSYSGVLGTGKTIRLLDSDGEEVRVYTAVVPGDMTGDSYVNGMDAFLITLVANGLQTENDLSAALFAASDMNADGFTDSGDIVSARLRGVKK